MFPKTAPFLAVILVPLAACDGSKDDVDDTGQGDAVVPEFGTADSRELEIIGTEEDELNVPRDLEFNPHSPDQLWVVNRATDSVTIFFDPGEADQESEWRKDAFGYHFMEEVSTIAWGAAGTYTEGEIGFATCHESRNTFDGTQQANGFMGPTLWPGGLDLFAEVNQHFGGEKAGSHLDMLHASPNCMGIAHEAENVYWVTDGRNGNLVRYDFKEDHGPGNEFHGDGVIRRYTEAAFTREKNVPGHLALDSDSGWLYWANTGEGTVMRMDIASGSKASDVPQSEWQEPLQEYSLYESATVETFVSGLDQPSGIAFYDDRIFVTDHGTGEILAFDLDGNELDRMETGAEALMGMDIGPAGRIWFVDADANTVTVINP